MDIAIAKKKGTTNQHKMLLSEFFAEREIIYILINWS